MGNIGECLPVILVPDRLVRHGTFEQKKRQCKKDISQIEEQNRPVDLETVTGHDHADNKQNRPGQPGQSSVKGASFSHDPSPSRSQTPWKVPAATIENRKAVDIAKRVEKIT